jgi:hypothetical protein
MIRRKEWSSLMVITIVRPMIQYIYQRIPVKHKKKIKTISLKKQEKFKKTLSQSESSNR